MDFVSKLPMGKTFNCHFGFFELPSLIIGVDVGSDGLLFHCEDGKYIAYTDDPKKEFKIRKVEDEEDSGTTFSESTFGHDKVRC